MKNYSRLLCLMLGLVLAGCNGSDKENSADNGKESGATDAGQAALSGVYRAVAQDVDGNPVEVQLIAESGRLPLLTLWDDREHQSSFLAQKPAAGQKQTTYYFAEIHYQCQAQQNAFVCDTPEGATRLVADSTAQHAGFVAGQYQAIWDGQLYTLSLDEQGNASIAGLHCESGVRFAASASLETIRVMTVDANNACHLPFSQVYAETVVDNDTLFSLNFQTEVADFPQVWVKVAG
ncbi:hypothetical protein [Photobacterium halotolerans]|uniref:Lipoprotein n=1 Tax=Photobacterium halotolerans TaxID=265726 RepID=A0A0F5VHI8_9GAMM|nr:hypothetical protein [Photobacterium halotolerans]KKD01626.1 hypothetical protein KY46_02155 [Photobacterium halotolerans]